MPTVERVVVNFEQSQELSKDHQGQVSISSAHLSLTAILDPQGAKVQLVAELGSRVRTLHEQYPGVCA